MHCGVIPHVGTVREALSKGMLSLHVRSCHRDAT